MTFKDFLLNEKQLIAPNSFDKKSKKKLPPNPNVYKEKDAGSSTKVEPQTVVVKNTNTGEVLGRRTIHQKKI